MTQATWTAVDEYLNAKLIGPDPVLDEALARNAEGGLPAFDVAPNQGKLLHLLARMSGAKRILEIGTLGGYSTIWLARALPAEGKLITLESEAKHAHIAAQNMERARLSHLVDIRLGPAIESLRQLVSEAAAPCDLVFIDADNPNNPAYLEWSLKLSRPGTVLVADNVIREGAIVEARSSDAKVVGVQQFFDLLAGKPHLSATAVQTVGSKGYDGFALAIVA